MLDKFISPWSEASDDELRSIKVICFDIDDTFSTEGKILAEAYNSLWQLHYAGFKLVPVTGRSAGWCDHIIRFWPVDAVIGENGAFVYYSLDGKIVREETAGKRSQKLRKKLEGLRKQIEKKIPKVVFASDQSFRDYDLAIDICEDVPPWSTQEVDGLIDFCQERGAQVKLSSIHVNTWFGDFDKSLGIKKWFNRGAPGLGETIPPWGEWLFIGDSPNDEPLFELFDKSIGVANLRAFLDRIEKGPKWMTSAHSGYGFVEMSQRLIGLKPA